MGKRNRGVGRISAPSTDYRDPDGNVLTLRGSMSPLTRRKYASTLHDQHRTTDDSWHRAVEFLFERLVERWTIFDVPTEGQRNCSSATASPRPTRSAGSATSCASTSRRTSPTWRLHRENQR